MCRNLSLQRPCLLRSTPRAYYTPGTEHFIYITGKALQFQGFSLNYSSFFAVIIGKRLHWFSTSCWAVEKNFVIKKGLELLMCTHLSIPKNPDLQIFFYIISNRNRCLNCYQNRFPVNQACNKKTLTPEQRECFISNQVWVGQLISCHRFSWWFLLGLILALLRNDQRPSWRYHDPELLNAR